MQNSFEAIDRAQRQRREKEKIRYRCTARVEVGVVHALETAARRTLKGPHMCVIFFLLPTLCYLVCAWHRPTRPITLPRSSMAQCHTRISLDATGCKDAEKATHYR